MKSRPKAGCIAGLVVLAALVGLGGYWYWRTFYPPHIGEDFASLSPAEKQQRRAEAQQLTREVRALAQAARRKEQRPFKLVVTERQLNTLLQDRLNTSAFPFKQPRVGMAPGRLSLQGQVAYQGLNAVATMHGNISLDNGELKYTAESFEVSGISIGSLRTKVQKEVTNALNRLVRDAPGRIEQVAVEEKQIVIQGQTD